MTEPVWMPAGHRILQGRCHVIDGDTIVIDGIKLRLAGIDAPELDHPWGLKSKWALVHLCRWQTVTARLRPELSYDRVVAECFLPDGRDLAAELVKRGLALDWPKFSGGKYRHLEPPDARQKLWRANVRQGHGCRSSQHGRFSKGPARVLRRNIGSGKRSRHTRRPAGSTCSGSAGRSFWPCW